LVAGSTFAGPLVRTEAQSTSHADILKETTAHLNFKASLGYTLTISIHPTEVTAPSEIDFDAGGHLEGTGRVTLTQRQPAQGPAWISNGASARPHGG
jgi:hypothetical protein